MVAVRALRAPAATSVYVRRAHVNGRNTSGLRVGSFPESAEVLRAKIATRRARLERYRSVAQAARGRRVADLLAALRTLDADELAVVFEGGAAALRTAIETERVTLWRLERRLAAREGAPRGTTEQHGATPQGEARAG